jgi:hypothetical protein
MEYRDRRPYPPDIDQLEQENHREAIDYIEGGGGSGRDLDQRMDIGDNQQGNGK